MINHGKKYTESNLSAKNEECITPIQLLQEIEPLLQEYFIGNFTLKNNALNMRFENGQFFRLVIGEAV